MSDLGSAFDAWLSRLEAEGAVRIRSQLNPPATPAALASAEHVLGHSFPPQMHALYAIANGQQLPEDFEALEVNQAGLGLIFGYYYFMPLEHVIAATQRWQSHRADVGALFEEKWNRYITVRSGDPVRAEYWYPGWIPIATDGDSHYGIDLAPAEGGDPGQVIMFSSADDERRVLAPDLATLFRRAATGREIEHDPYATCLMFNLEDLLENAA